MATSTEMVQVDLKQDIRGADEQRTLYRRGKSVDIPRDLAERMGLVKPIPGAEELPADFPMRDVLMGEHKLTTVAMVAALSDEALLQLSGIGETTVKKISEREDVKAARAAAGR